MGESTYSYNSLDDNTLARLSKNGDDNAFNELAMRYLNTINFIARKYSAEGYEQNDFVQEGLLALLYACRTFDENGSSGFKNYMSVVVERRFISIIRKSSTQKAVPKSALVQLDDLGDTLEDLSQTPEELLMCREHLQMVLDKLKNVLSKTEFEVVMLYGNGLGYKEIAKKLSISEKSADNALQRARRKICNINMS
ncbi:sigma-70 family RNA polymerase sigma factor [Ruminococcus sp.]|uniref:sigma-70 family RNA polymerase sigma factor n=1 Tax=Ruminococcus sp. TaxID=41978 RepID=UPI0025CFFE0D|nr:sigma-70 family RNA polymerase sigma factor [Ruminococcus sp.]MCI6616968.1 sigma-70 family RNA polymerase sigma factor [Ruminococcus sp.]